MKNSPIYFAVFVIGGLSLSVGASQAQQQRPPKPDFSSIASELNVPEAALMDCLGERPKSGQRPAKGARPQGPNASKVTSCLEMAGYSVTEKAVDGALAAAGPPKR